ncbi:MAG: nickel pincer cofactor biosynthesis protein LarC [Candidatus Omnitrophota bacterium]
MTRIAYLDCFSGISGDMLLGAFIDCGLKVADLKKELVKLNVKGIDIKTRRVRRGHISGTKVDVIAGGKIRFSSLKSIFKLIDNSKLDSKIKDSVKNIYTNLAKAEAEVHHEKLEQVHFHQLGALDTIVDIVGAVVAINLLGIEQLYSSSITLGTGMVRCGKDVFPLPAPATLQLIKGRTVCMDPSISHELVTPTGAAILATLAKEVKFLPMNILKVGYGAGSYNDPALPNLLTLIIAESKILPEKDNIIVVETNIDDTLALNFEVLFERLFAAGALDVYTVSVMMKKMRPGILLSVQVCESRLDEILEIIFEETTTLGVRINNVSRRKLQRKILKLKSEYGIIVRVKIAALGAKTMNIAPEYEDCKRIALKKNLPFKKVYEKIKAQALKEFA